MSQFKSAARKILTNPLAVRAIRPVFLGPKATIFTFHRFASAADGDPAAVSALELRRALEFLRKSDFKVVPLNSLLVCLREGRQPIRNSVAITVDDGYGDFASVAAPIFAEYRVPVTTFLISGFLDGRLLLWWDKIEHAFLHSRRSRLDIALPNFEVAISWTDAAGARLAAQAVIEALKRLPEAEKSAAMARIQSELDAAIPEECPPCYRPMTWDEVRYWADRGVRFGPHSETHPILPRVGEPQAKREIEQSWARLQAETAGVVPIFCFPNGDFGERELRLVAAAGLEAAASTHPGHTQLGRERSRLPVLPRFSYPGFYGFAQVLSGITGARVRLRAASFLPRRRQPPDSHGAEKQGSI